jgi:enterochelin esterase family protein
MKALQRFGYLQAKALATHSRVNSLAACRAAEYNGASQIEEVTLRLVRLLCVLLVFGGTVSGQSRPVSFGSPVGGEMQSGETHDYILSATGGDLVTGTINLRGAVGRIEILSVANAVLRTDYIMGSDSGPQRIGFAAPATGTYHIRIKTFDRFDGGPQWSPGPLVPVVGTARATYTLQFDKTSVAARIVNAQTLAAEKYSSRRLQRLAADLQKGHTDALPAFWREVAGKGPLIEEIPGNDRDFDVTFLWREIYETRNVYVEWPTSSARPEEYSMSRLSGTDVWYKTMRLRRGTRQSYRLSPNDLPSDSWATSQVDPLNPRVFPDDPSYPYAVSSVLDTPGAPDEQWVTRKPVRRGQIEEKKYTSKLLNNERDIWIYTPPGYTQTAGPYPFVLLFDGAAYVSDRFGNAPATLDNLINDGRIRPAIVCFLPAVNRGVEQGLTGADRYSDAVVQELLPTLRASLPITNNPADIVVAGFSNGGMSAALFALHHPEVFGNVLSQSGSFRGRRAGSDEPNTISEMYIAAPRAPIRFYIETGLYDNAPNTSLPIYEMILDETNLQGNRHFRDVLRAKGYDVTYREVGGAHEQLHWRAMLADGLMTLLGRPAPRLDR